MKNQVHMSSTFKDRLTNCLHLMLRALFLTASILQLLLTNLIIALNITKYNYKPQLFSFFPLTT